ncbi:SPOR domain-containing protein [Antarctobacter jejuensis]|uniref:SPOR domain-containing protein n=1 Tax=Antarctobacter jejuensis TaxID=1439938 RepID=UPI003FD2123D
MTLKSFSFIALLVSGFGISSQPAAAQSSVRDVPANFPPASYDGRQFVDNRGCVYIRAGVDGAVTWVPRVSRQREQVCGQTPTFGPQVAQPAVPAPTPAPAPAPKVAAKPAATAAPAPKRTATTAAAPRPAPRAVAPSVVRAPASKPVAAPPPRVVRRVPAPQPQVVTKAKPVTKAPSGAKVLPMGPIKVPAQIACANGQSYRMIEGKKVRIRCGPQQAPHATIIRRGDAPTGKNVYYNRNSWEDGNLTLSPETMIVPDHVYEQRDTQVAHVPKGYRPAWSDDRLNRWRAYQTVQGHADTQQVWTNTVPRKLVTQVRRHKVKQPVIVGKAAEPAALVPVVSAKSQGKAKYARWIEVGAFSTDDKAKAAARRLNSAGLSVRMGKFARNGQTFAILRVGPYASPDALDRALNRVHGTGYTQAYIR